MLGAAKQREGAPGQLEGKQRAPARGCVRPAGVAL